ncbi:MAG TPA: YbhB/YbcL family Raf kinase inhibitor-like protein [Crinalium sp.]|jgi:hypothetical protein
MEIRSPAFFIGNPIPFSYTCDGDNISLPLNWEDPPPNTQSFALILEDRDAPQPNFTHWVVYNLPADCRGLPENVGGDRTLSNGAMQGKNDFDQIGFGGPCPPDGTHRYFFKLLALDCLLDLQPGVTKAELLSAIEGHVIDAAEVMGRYTKAGAALQGA